ncbi:MAG: tRNA (N(6)-L-threonylcarbamoyladenosine(37)-C(2))-methylthiotransferase [Candidatus Altarchaeum sp.]|nr:tRNA (N(6)-L-threonylcarbamoyladenosine(37)-C(2))-methylthiotransferase [Candidatus Altarchaeum sp.]
MKFKILTYGCAMNKSDSEHIAGIIKEKFKSNSEIEEYFIEKTKNFADEEEKLKADENHFLIINTCIVKQPTENKILDLMRKIEKKTGNKGENKERINVIITGCLPAAYPKICDKFKFSFIGTNVSDIIKAIDEEIEGRKFVKIEKQGNKLCIPKFSFNKFISIIPISEGCVGNCSYCSTKLARQNLISYKEENITETIKNAEKCGAKEIYITGQDTGCYGLDINTNIVCLLEKISEIEGKFKVRVGMMNPNFALKFLDELIEIFKHQKFYKFIHIPVQSGSNAVLRDMKRNYCVEDFIRIAEKFKSINASISTDIIVGFPTETDDDFKCSVELIKVIKPEFLNLSKFYVRKGTLAERFIRNKQWTYDTKIAKERSLLISKIFGEISRENNKRWLNWKGEILTDEIENGMLIGRNFAYKKIHIKDKQELLGKFVHCRIIKAGEILEGEILGSVIN